MVFLRKFDYTATQEKNGKIKPVALLFISSNKYKKVSPAPSAQWKRNNRTNYGARTWGAANLESGCLQGIIFSPNSTGGWPLVDIIICEGSVISGLQDSHRLLFRRLLQIIALLYLSAQVQRVVGAWELCYFNWKLQEIHWIKLQPPLKRTRHFMLIRSTLSLKCNQSRLAEEHWLKESGWIGIDVDSLVVYRLEGWKGFSFKVGNYFQPLQTERKNGMLEDCPDTSGNVLEKMNNIGWTTEAEVPVAVKEKVVQNVFILWSWQCFPARISLSKLQQHMSEFIGKTMAEETIDIL